MAKRNSKKNQKKSQQHIPAKRSEPEPMLKEFMEIGGAPMPGVHLKQILEGHLGQIEQIAWSPDGCYLASLCNNEGTVRIWDAKKWSLLKVIDFYDVECLAWSPDSNKLAFGGIHGTISVWSAETFTIVGRHESSHHRVSALSWSPDGHMLASCDRSGNVLIWNTECWDIIGRYNIHRKNYANIPIINSEDLDSIGQNYSAFISTKHLISDFYKEKFISDLNTYYLSYGVHKIPSIEWQSDGTLMLAFSSKKRTVFSFLDLAAKSNLKHEIRGFAFLLNFNPEDIIAFVSGAVIKINKFLNSFIDVNLEGHTDLISCISFSSDGRILASKSIDGTVRLWKMDAWEEIGRLMENGNFVSEGVAFHPTLPILATLGKNNSVIRIWDINMDVLLGRESTSQSVNYTTAKLALVGDSMVGKTVLGWRLAHNEFKIQPSTHGQQFWIAKSLSSKRQDGTECEAVLWDLAGQHIYRPLHSIFFWTMLILLWFYSIQLIVRTR